MTAENENENKENTGDAGAAAADSASDVTVAEVTAGDTGTGATLADIMPTGVGEPSSTAPDAPQPDSQPAGPQLDAFGRAYATGRRKDAVARVWIKPGAGRISVNGREFDNYFARATLRMVINQPFEVADRKDQFDVVCTVTGGGLSGQAGAVRHGISRALVNFEPGLRSVLKKRGFLTRDPRVVERKKYGRAKARRSFQFSKR